jgi:hypothetical protein
MYSTVAAVSERAHVPVAWLVLRDSVFDKSEQCFRLLLTIYHHLASKKPVTGVLTATDYRLQTVHCTTAHIHRKKVRML